jgi:hypothetical protein
MSHSVALKAFPYSPTTEGTKQQQQMIKLLWCCTKVDKITFIGVDDARHTLPPEEYSVGFLDEVNEAHPSAGKRLCVMPREWWPPTRYTAGKDDAVEVHFS